MPLNVQHILLGTLIATGPAAEPPEMTATRTASPSPPPASARPSDRGFERPLGLDEVLDSVADQHPLMEAADLKIEGQKGKIRKSKGAFDPKLKAKGLFQPVGYYQWQQADVLLEADTRLWGISAYTGWRVGRGFWPSYDAKKSTGSGGELRAGINVPVWNGGRIDERRAELRKAELELDGVELDRVQKRLELELKAAHAYWDWVSAGAKLEIEESLAAMADLRFDGISRQVAAGSRPSIDLVDAERQVFDRRGRVVAAERDLTQKRNKLSLYWRTGDGQPMVASDGRLPPNFPPMQDPQGMPVESDVQAAIGRRPDLRRFQVAADKANVDLRLAKNQIVPRIDVQAYAASDFGTADPALQDSFTTAINDEPFEFGAGVMLELPIPLRKARGAREAARADRNRTLTELRFAQESVATDVRNAHAELLAAHVRADLAKRQREANDTLAEAERKRLNEGASDLLYVNLRELYAAESAIKQVKAQADYWKALASYETATAAGISTP